MSRSEDPWQINARGRGLRHGALLAVCLSVALAASSLSQDVPATVKDAPSFSEYTPGVLFHGLDLVYEPGAVVIADVIQIRSPIGCSTNPSPSICGSAVRIRIVDVLAGSCPDTIEIWSSARVLESGDSLAYLPSTGGAQELAAIGQRLLIALAPSARRHDPTYHPEKAALWWPRGEYWVVAANTNARNVDRAELHERIGFDVSRVSQEAARAGAFEAGRSLTRPSKKNAVQERQRMLDENAERKRLYEAGQRWREEQRARQH